MLHVRTSCAVLLLVVTHELWNTSIGTDQAIPDAGCRGPGSTYKTNLPIHCPCPVSYVFANHAWCAVCMCTQVPVSYWGADSGEGDFTFYKGQLLAGCMDKAQFGKYGLVHAMQVRPAVCKCAST